MNVNWISEVLTILFMDLHQWFIRLLRSGKIVLILKTAQTNQNYKTVQFKLSDTCIRKTTRATPDITRQTQAEPLPYWLQTALLLFLWLKWHLSAWWQTLWNRHCSSPERKKTHQHQYTHTHTPSDTLQHTSISTHTHTPSDTLQHTSISTHTRDKNNPLTHSNTPASVTHTHTHTQVTSSINTRVWCDFKTMNIQRLKSLHNIISRH